MDFRSFLMTSFLYDWFGKRSYAQSGEDLIAWGELQNSKTQELKNSKHGKMGFYVDVGAFHPKVFSNTYLFYKKGWRGLCVEPNPKMKKLFEKARPGDVFLNLGVGDVKKLKNSRNQELKMEYFEFEDGAANTFSPEQARRNQQESGRKLIGKREIRVMPLGRILDKYLPKEQKIDLLSVDVEGMDLAVLKSNDWKKYRPEMIIAEDLEFDWREPKKSAVTKYLSSLGYELKARTSYSLIYKFIV